jgi:hypothetical protein
MQQHNRVRTAAQTDQDSAMCGNKGCNQRFNPLGKEIIGNHGQAR